MKFRDSCVAATEIELVQLHEGPRARVLLSLKMAGSAVPAWLDRPLARRLAAALSHWADTGELVDPGEAPAPSPAQPSPGGVMSGLAGRVDKLENFVENLGLDARLVTNMCGGIGETKDRLAMLEGDVAALRAELAGKVSLDEADRLQHGLDRTERGVAQHDKLFVDMDERLKELDSRVNVDQLWNRSQLKPRLASLEAHAALRWVPEQGEHETVDIAAGAGGPSNYQLATAAKRLWEAWGGDVGCGSDFQDARDHLFALCREPAP